jgi:hypothetical protein
MKHEHHSNHSVPKDRTEKFKTWSEIISSWVTIAGIFGAFWAYYEWDVSRGDHAVDFLFKLNDQFNTPDVAAGRDLIDWDVEYDKIKDELKTLADRNSLFEENEMRKTNSVRNAELIEIDNKIKKLDAMLQFYETLNVVHQQKQAPAGWLKTRYSDWLDYYYDTDRNELRLYVDHYYPSLSNWLHVDLTLPADKRYFHPRPTSPFYTNNFAH